MPNQKRATESQLGELAQSIIGDVEKLVGQHLDLLRAEVKEEVTHAKNAAVSMAAGTGCVALGGVLGSLMAVHLVHRTTRLPLWASYGLVGGALAALGGSLLYSGGRTLGELSFNPTRETVQALKEDVQWVKGQASNAAT